MRELARLEKEAPWEGVSAAATSSGLYEEHEIKVEMVIGPEVLQPPDIVYALRANKSQLKSMEFNDTVTSSECMESLSIDSCNDQLDKMQQSDEETQPVHNDEQVIPRIEKEIEEIIHTNNNPLQCEVCSRQFSQKQYLTRHQRTHLVNKLHSCTICKKQFKEKVHLVSHLKNHTRQELFPCDVCNKQFVSSRNLNNHKQMHAAGDTPYSCDTCEKKFSHKSYLSTHKRIHLPNKLYACDVCGKQFLSNYQVNNHKQSHITEKPYKCKNCKKEFAHNKYFVKHIWICKM